MIDNIFSADQIRPHHYEELEKDCCCTSAIDTDLILLPPYAREKRAFKRASERDIRS